MARTKRRSGRRLALLLAPAAGATDAIGYRALFHLFTAHMTGNTVAMAANAGTGMWQESARRAFPIGLFVAGVFMGALLARATSDRRRTSRLPLLLEACLLAAFALLGPRVTLGDVTHPAFGYWALAALLALAMGLQTAALRHIGDESVRTTFVTGMLTSAAEKLLEWRSAPSAGARARARSRALFALSIWGAYALAAVLATAVHIRFGFAAMLLPLGLLAVAVALADAGGRRVGARFSPKSA